MIIRISLFTLLQILRKIFDGSLNDFCLLEPENSSLSNSVAWCAQSLKQSYFASNDFSFRMDFRLFLIIQLINQIS